MTENRFAHEKLEAYRVAREFFALAYPMARDLPRGEAALRDQLKRAATSILLNTAEGACRRPGPEKARFFDVARGSASECGAILDAFALLGLAEVAAVDRGRALLQRCVGLLAGLSRSALARAGRRAVGPGP